MTLLDATEPPEARGLARDEVRLLVARPGAVEHRQFLDFATALEPGDLVVVNTSATLAAALAGQRADGRAVTVHVAAQLPDGQWVVELRPAVGATGPVPDARAGEQVLLPSGARLRLIGGYLGSARLWRAEFAAECSLTDLLTRRGRPISYAYVPCRWPLAAYQTVFADEPGSAEMPSAGRPFSAQIVTDLAVRGVTVAPLTLHTGLSSPEQGEPPQPERFAVPTATARLVEHTRRYGGRVVAVGTTVTRALETVGRPDSSVVPGSGWTDLVLGPDRPARVVDGLVTGWHPPGASHLLLLQAVAGRELVQTAYDAADGYLAHEFGDSCLLLP